MPGSYTIREAAQILGRPISYYPAFTEICQGNANAGIFLSLFYYWEGKQKDADGWIYKTQAEVCRETALGRYGQESARKALRGLALMEEEIRGANGKSGRLHYRFDWPAVDRLLAANYNGGLELIEGQRITAGKAEDWKAQIRSTNQCYPAKVAIDEFYIEWMNWKAGTEGEQYEYAWTKKEKGQLKNLVSHFRGRLAKKTAIPGHEDAKMEISPEIVAQAGIRPFLELYLEMARAGEWNMQSFTVSNMMSHLADIISKMQAYASRKAKGEATPNPKRAKGHSFTGEHARRVQGVVNWGRAEE